MISKIEKYYKEFRNYCEFWNLNLAIKAVILPKLLNNLEFKHKAILSYLEDNYSDIINKYRIIGSRTEHLTDDCPIWICWFQGEEQMPLLVKKCLETVRKNKERHTVNVITFDNYKKYVSIPQFIIDKVRRNEISLTHFSDIIRNNLLADHGGIWLDATIYLTCKLKGWDLPFYTIKQNRPDDHIYVSGYKWTGFCMGGVKGNPLNSFVKDFFNEYHKREKCLIDYFLIDYVIALGYKNILAIKELIDVVPYSNPDLYYIQKNMTKPVDKNKLKQVFESTSIFKLTYKFKQPQDRNTLYYFLGFGDENN